MAANFQWLHLVFYSNSLPIKAYNLFSTAVQLSAKNTHFSAIDLEVDETIASASPKVLTKKHGHILYQQ